METLASLHLLGLAELAELLGLSRSAAMRRTHHPDFPPPAARLRSGPVWERSQIEEYARERAERYVERQAVQELAAVSSASDMPAGPAGVSDGQPRPLPPGVLSLEEAGRILGREPIEFVRLWAVDPQLPGTFSVSTGQLRGIPRQGLGQWARRLGLGEAYVEERLIPKGYA